MENRTVYQTNTRSAEDLILHMMGYLSVREKMETQRINSEDGNYTIVQAKINHSGLRKIVGLDRAVTIRFRILPTTVETEIGNAKWIDKSIVLTVAMFVAFWWLAIPAGRGIYAQRKLLKDVKAEMDFFMKDDSTVSSDSNDPEQIIEA